MKTMLIVRVYKSYLSAFACKACAHHGGKFCEALELLGSAKNMQLAGLGDVTLQPCTGEQAA